MLNDFDDYLIHQTSFPITYPVGSDLRFFDRFIINVHDHAGQMYLFTGLGSYPNNNCMDGFACAVVAGKPYQLNSRFFRPLDNDRHSSIVGPLAFRVLEPMRRWKLQLAQNLYGMAFDIDLTARFDPWECKHLLYRSGAGVLMDQHHYVQSNRYSGTLTVDGETYNVDGCFGMRDRSWGVRGGVAGIPAPGGTDVRGSGGRGLHFWLTPQFDDSCYFVFYQEDADGQQSYIDGGIMGGPKAGRRWVRVEHDVQFIEATMVHAAAEYRLTDDAGEVHRLKSKLALPGIYLSGAGYGTTQGRHVGAKQEGERWELVNADAPTLNSYGLGGDQLASFECEGRQGYGIVEHAISPDHPRYRRSIARS